MGTSAVTLSLGFARAILLARWLAPEQFGLMALALFFVDLLNRLRDLGYDHDLVRDNTPSDDKVAAHYWLQVASGVAMMLMSLCLAPAWRRFYPDRNLLVPVIVALSAGHLVTCLGGTPLIMLRKVLGFGQIARIDLVKACVKTACVLILARAGAGVWALVAEALLEASILTAAVWLVHPIKLGWSWDRATIRGYLAYGTPLFASQLIAFLLMQLDDFWVGTRLGDAALGYYALAYSLSEYPRRVVSDPIQQVILATMARVQADRLRLSQTLYRSGAYLVRMGMWAGGVVALVAPDFVSVLIGDKWLPAVAALRALAFFSMALPLVAVAVNLLVATGDAAAVLRVRLLQLALFAPAVVVGVRLLGYLGAALAADLMVLAGLVALLRRARRHTDFSVSKLLGAPLLALGVGAGLVWATGHGLGTTAPALRLIVLGAVASAGYLGTLVLVERREARLALSWGLRALRHTGGG